MEFSRSLPVFSRRALAALGVAAVLCAASSLRAQTPPAQTPPAQTQPQPPPDQLKFTGDVPVLIVYSIKPEKAADFEAGWLAIRAAFAKAAATKPELKAFDETLTKMSKVDLSLASITNPAGSPAVYILQIDTPSKTLSYNPVKIIYETLHNNAAAGGVLTRAEADEIWNKLNGFTSINPWPLVKVGS